MTQHILLIFLSTVFAYEFSNIYFSTFINNNKLILTSQYNSVNIIINNNDNYNLSLDENDIIEDVMFLYDDFYTNYMNEHLYKKIKLTNNNLNISYEMKYDINDITNTNNNYFDININNINNKSILLIFDESYYYNGINMIRIKDFIIIFEESNLINLERFGHYFYIHFNDNKSTYNFIIKYNNDKLSS